MGHRALGPQFPKQGALPMENGLYYRSHPKDRPFSREDATTQNLAAPTTGSFAPGGSLHHITQPKEGYSAFWSPHHVAQYHEEMGWSMKGRKIVAFRGTPVGEGADGEPRVMPEHDKPVATLSPKQFTERLDYTQHTGTSWGEHTWGEGPKGRIVDDGYRNVFGK